MAHLEPFSTILVGLNGTKRIVDLSRILLGRFPRLKSHVKALGFHMCTMEPFYAQAPLGAKTPTEPNIYSDYWTNFYDSKAIWNEAHWLGHFL